MSILVGTFGDAKWQTLAAERAVPSAHAQTLPAREVIHVHAGTLHEARNGAAEQATSEWLCFLDADDELDPGYLEAMAAAHQRDGGDLLGPAVVYVNGGKPEPPKVWPECDLAHGNYLVIGTLVRRSMFHAVGGFRDWPFYEDWCLWQRCWLAGARPVTVPDALYIAHVRTLSRNRAPGRAEREQVHAAIRDANLGARA